MEVIIFFSATLLLYLGICSLYLLLFAVAGRFAKKASVATKIDNCCYKMAVLIPAYKEDAVIVDVARQSLLQTYPQDLYDVIIICDSLQPKTIDSLKALPVKLIQVQFTKSTKAKAINTALEQLPAYDIAIVLDADNVMDRSFLKKISREFNNGHIVVQGHRVAKNINTSIAVLDAISEEINNHIFRKAHCALGVSSALIGSAMAFDYCFFKNKMQKISAVSGFDKELELAILKEGMYIHYAEDALVMDEKVQRITDFRNQRTRWVAAQIKYLFTHFFSGVVALFKGNPDYADKVFQFMLPPRVIMLGLLGILILVLFFLQQAYWGLLAFAILIVLAFALYISAPKELIRKFSWKEALNIPVLFLQFILSFVQARKARYTFIHTPHREISKKQD
jgi:cellulose synthase/poly-beta-1,6-N-acetylglucosamine synthase-like glycosyltransferase